MVGAGELGGGDSSHGRWRVYRRRWIHAGGEGGLGVWEGRRDVTHARGTVNASAIRQMHETPPPPVFRAHQISPTTLLYLSNWLPSPLLPAHACNPPMLNATFASPPIYIRPHVSLFPPGSLSAPLLMNHLSGSLFPRRSRSRFSAFLPAFYPTPGWPVPVYVFIVCA